jgi:hypothetical protein
VLAGGGRLGDMRLRRPAGSLLYSYGNGLVGAGPAPSEGVDRKPLDNFVEDAPEGGFSARAVGESIFTEAETVDELRTQVRDAVHCHFDSGEVPKLIRLHFVRDEVIAA